MHKLRDTAEQLWKKSPRYKKLVCIDPIIKLNSFTKLTSNLHCEQASILFQLRTRHMPLNAYLYKIQKLDSPICSNFHQHRETVMHYILHCPAYNKARRYMFQKASRDMRNLGKLLSTKELLPHLFRFIKNTGCLRLCNGNADMTQEHTN